MPLRTGVVTDVEAPPIGPKAILRVTLKSGARVYVPTTLFEQAPLQPEEQYFFVERGPLGRVEWYGTILEVPAAVEAGIVTADEVSAIGLTPAGKLDMADDERMDRYHDAVWTGKSNDELTKAAANTGCALALVSLVLSMWVAARRR